MNITPVALLGQYKEDNQLLPAAKILNKDQSVVFDPVFVAGSVVSLYEAFLSHVAEDKQTEFEKQFRACLTRMLDNKEQYTIKFDDLDN